MGAKYRYGVSMPFTGYVYVEVEAGDQKSAIAAAWDVLNSDDFNFDSACAEMEYHETIGEGNVSHAVLNSVSVARIKE